MPNISNRIVTDENRMFGYSRPHNYNFKQVLLRKRTTEKSYTQSVVWIPTYYAIEGSLLKIRRDNMSEWSDNYQVIEVYEERPYYEINQDERSYHGCRCWDFSAN